MMISNYAMNPDYMYSVIADPSFDFDYLGSPYSTVAAATTPVDAYYGGITGPWSYTYASAYLYNQPTYNSSYINGPSMFSYR